VLCEGVAEAARGAGDEVGGHLGGSLKLLLMLL
jgi:hypothetical protein